MTLDQVRGLLGDSDYEDDTWAYNLSLNGAPPPGPQTIRLLLNYPQLYVHFREGLLDKVSATHGLDLSKDADFIAKL